MATLADIYAQQLYDELNYRDVTAPTAAYQQSVLGAQRDRKRRDLNIAHDRAKTSLWTPVTEAGLGNSGIAGEHYTQFQTDQTNAIDDLNASYEEARQQILLELANARRQIAIRGGQTEQAALQSRNADVIGGIA